MVNQAETEGDVDKVGSADVAGGNWDKKSFIDKSIKTKNCCFKISSRRKFDLKWSIGKKTDWESFKNFRLIIKIVEWLKKAQI